MTSQHIHPLPPVLVKLLEEKKSKGKPSPATTVAWAQLRQKLARVSSQLGYLASHEELEKIAYEVASLLASLDADLNDSGKHLEFQQNCYKLYTAMSRYADCRRQLSVTELEAVNTLIHAIQAHLRGNLPAEALKFYEAEMQKEVSELLQLYKDVAPDLPDEARQALLKGIDSFTHARKLLQNAEPSSLKNASIDLKNGALLLEHLVKWRRDFFFSQQSPVPVVGDTVRQMLAQLQNGGKLDQQTLHHWVEERFWDLQEHWAQSRHDFFMPRYKKDKLVGQIDGLMLALRDLDQLAPRDQEQLLFRLESHYEDLVDAGFDMSKFETHTLHWLAELFVAILKKGVPRYQILETIDHFKNTNEAYYAVFLQKYLDEDDRDYILDALAKMASECEIEGFRSTILDR